jgi:hypothetical protein
MLPLSWQACFPKVGFLHGFFPRRSLLHFYNNPCKYPPALLLFLCSCSSISFLFVIVPSKDPFEWGFPKSVNFFNFIIFICGLQISVWPVFVLEISIIAHVLILVTDLGINSFCVGDFTYCSRPCIGLQTGILPSTRTFPTTFCLPTHQRNLLSS